MTGCAFRTVSLLVLYTLINSVNSQWNFTLLDNGVLYSLYNCTCTEQTACTNNSTHVSTTVLPTNTSSTQVPTNSTHNTTVPSSNTTPAHAPTSSALQPTSFQIKNCTCLNETEKCPDSRNTSSSNTTTIWVQDINNSTFHKCDIQEHQPPCSNGSFISELIKEANDTNKILEGILSNLAKFINCSTTGADLNVDSICENSTMPSSAPNIASATNTTAATTTPDTPAANLTGMITTVIIVGANILLAIGVCTFIMCKRRQINVNYERQRKIIKAFSKATGTDRTHSNNIEEEDNDNTRVKTIVF